MGSGHLKLPITASSAASSPSLFGLRIRHKQFPEPAIPSLLLLPCSVSSAWILSGPLKELLNLSDSKIALLFLFSLWASYGGQGAESRCYLLSCESARDISREKKSQNCEQNGYSIRTALSFSRLEMNFTS